MKITIVGGSGFVGSNIPQEFANKHQIQNVDLVPLKLSHIKECIIGNIKDSKVVEKIKIFDPDWILVFAGNQYTSPQQSRKKRAVYFHENVELAQSLVNSFAYKAHQPNFLYISTDMVYGLPTQESIREDCMPKPIGYYGRSKIVAERIFSENFRCVAILRPRLIVGPGRAGTIKSLASIIKAGLPIPILGAGHNRYQMIGVSDLWDAMEIILETNQFGVFNIGSDSPPTLNELFQYIKYELTLNNPILHINPKLAHFLLSKADWFGVSPLAYEQFALASENCLLSTKKIKSLGWVPKHNDASLMKETLIELLGKNN